MYADLGHFSRRSIKVISWQPVYDNSCCIRLVEVLRVVQDVFVSLKL